MEFLDMMHSLFDMEKALPVDMEVAANESSGIITVSFYGGLDNARMLNQARQMFEPVN
jgi:hypothetical protein